MKLRLLSTFAAFLSVAAVAACATSAQTKIADGPADGTTPTDTTTPAAEESDDPALQPPHSLGTIVLGEAHSAGTSKSTPIVSATFIPDALLGKACTKKLNDACTIAEVPKCTKVTSSSTGCNSNELCSFDTSCKAVCKPMAVCETSCEADEVCKATGTGTSGTGTANGTCVKVGSFDAGPLAFSGTTTSITMFPPYSFEGTGSGAPFLGGAELHVQASGATDAGFEKFDEKFTATTFLQTTPSLSKITRDKVFGTGALPVAWAPANDTILITVSGAGGSATCKVQDSLGKYDVPRSVIKAAQGDGTTSSSGSSISLSVARQRKEVKKDKHAKTSLDMLTVQPDGWLELITLSTESASYQGCSSGQDMCGDTCTDVTYDSQNCGACGNKCSVGQSCYNGACSGGSSSGTGGTSCTTCRSNAKVGSCSTYNTTCNADSSCNNLSYCASSCTTASCISSCESSYPAGVTKWNPLKSCLSSYCSSSCGF